jgi:acetyl-CoA C-acetyltransferase
MQDAYLFDAVRTPRDCRLPGSALNEIKPIDLLGSLLEAVQLRNGLQVDEIDDLLLGVVQPLEDYSVNIARAALMKMGWGQGVSGMTLNRNAASGLSALNLAATKLGAGIDSLVLAGGVDSLSRTMLRPLDTNSISDPEWLRLARYIPQSLAADLLGTHVGVTREAADGYAVRSWQRALQAQQEGRFTASVISLTDRNGLPLLKEDQIRWENLTREGLAQLDPVNPPQHTPGFHEIALSRFPHLEAVNPMHTEGNSAPLTDGAALLLLGTLEKGRALGLRPRARIRSMSHCCSDPVIAFLGATEAARQCLKLAGMTTQDVQLWQCNEPFAAIPLYFEKAMDVPEERLNPNGGAIALGKAVAASGAMLMGMLLEEMERLDLETGLAAVAAEGGAGVATLIERI